MQNLIDRDSGVDHNLANKPWASVLRLISRNALASGSARLMIDAAIRIYSESGLKQAAVCESVVAGTIVADDLTNAGCLAIR
jgi:hypothetical protein